MSSINSFIDSSFTHTAVLPAVSRPNARTAIAPRQYVLPNLQRQIDEHSFHAACTFGVSNCFCFIAAGAQIWSTPACCSVDLGLDRLVVDSQPLALNIIPGRKFIHLVLGVFVSQP
jgi:hypothetical protein